MKNFTLNIAILFFPSILFLDAKELISFKADDINKVRKSFIDQYKNESIFKNHKNIFFESNKEINTLYDFLNSEKVYFFDLILCIYSYKNTSHFYILSQNKLYNITSEYENSNSESPKTSLSTKILDNDEMNIFKKTIKTIDSATINYHNYYNFANTDKKIHEIIYNKNNSLKYICFISPIMLRDPDKLIENNLKNKHIFSLEVNNSIYNFLHHIYNFNFDKTSSK